MSEIDEMEDCRDPRKAKLLMAAFFARRLREGTDIGGICALLAEAIETDRLVFKKRRHRMPGEPHMAADLRDLDWWAERLAAIKEDD